jgi:hypothetical protein
MSTPLEAALVKSQLLSWRGGDRLNKFVQTDDCDGHNRLLAAYLSWKATRDGIPGKCFLNDR